MFRIAKTAAVAITAAMLASTAAIAAPAGNIVPQQLAQAAPAQTAATKAARRVQPDRVEARINELKKRLKINDTEADKWNAFSQLMRDNATRERSLIEQRDQARGTMSAVDDMKSYQQITQAHADGIAKLVPAFQDLYAAMPPDQQKNADQVFGSFGKHPMAHHAKHMTPKAG